MWTDSETMKCFSNTCWLLLLLTVRVTHFQLMREIFQCHKAVVHDSEVHKADEVREVRLVGEIDEVCEVREADE